MRTTLKRGIGRATAVNGNGRSVLPPTILSTVNRYEQPHHRRSAWRRVGAVLVWMLVAASSLVLASAAGAYLYFHESISAVAAHSKDVKLASKHLDIPLPNAAYRYLMAPRSRRSAKSATCGAELPSTSSMRSKDSRS